MQRERAIEVLWASTLKQFGARAARAVYELIRAGELEVELSATGNPKVVRRVVGGREREDILYFNPLTGALTLSREGARMMFPLIEKNKKRIVVRRREFCEHVRGSLLAPVVVRVTSDVKAGDEVFVVDEQDELLAVAKALVSSEDLALMRRGEVARIRRRVGC